MQFKQNTQPGRPMPVKEYKSVWNARGNNFIHYEKRTTWVTLDSRMSALPMHESLIRRREVNSRLHRNGFSVSPLNKWNTFESRPPFHLHKSDVALLEYLQSKLATEFICVVSLHIPVSKSEIVHMKKSWHNSTKGPCNFHSMYIVPAGLGTISQSPVSINYFPRI